MTIRNVDPRYYYCLACLKQPTPVIGQRVNGKCRACGDAHGMNHLPGHALLAWERLRLWHDDKRIDRVKQAALEHIAAEACDVAVCEGQDCGNSAIAKAALAGHDASCASIVLRAVPGRAPDPCNCGLRS